MALYEPLLIIGFEQLLWLLYEPLLIIGFEQLVWLYRYINSITFQNAISLFLSYLEKANIEKINESEAESGSETKSDSESISSCNAAEKRKFEDDESDKSDTSSESNVSNNDHVPVILKDIPKRSEDYDDDDSDEPFLDNEDYNNGNPIPNNEDYDKNSDRQSLDNKDCDEEDDKGDIETESDCSQTSAYISEENDELTDDDKEFEESEMTNINDDELIQGLRLLHTKVLHSISDIAFNKILDNVNSNLTIYKLKKKINSIVPFEPHRYDTCKNSCIAFTSSYENLASCPICGENRFDDNGKPVNTTFFFSVKERLIIQYKNKERAEELQYRSNYSQNKGEEEIYADIFDGLLYKDLLQRGFFKDERDIALSGTCDGYQIFEQRTDDCWVILLINNNLHPSIRVKKENLLVTMIIPGPRSPKNFNSFLCPLIKELQELEGVQCIDGRTNEPFILRAHLLTWTGDVPALSKSLNLSGHNSYKGCRFLYDKRDLSPIK
ncbi:transposase domain-containing protein [Rhizophagus irregularis DAOM 181602=DAOM 197198]|nr:transposase domain-containing protein [Rhizophagus irregularis DAOM 181602=DAOM 197198]